MATKDLEISRMIAVDISCNGWSYKTVFMLSPDGWYMTILNWQCISVKLAPPTDTMYNSSKIGRLLNDTEAGEKIANEFYNFFMEGQSCESN